MRILQVISSIATGGAERMLANLAHHLCDAGHTVGVVSMRDPDGVSVEKDLRANGVEVYLLGKKPGLDLRMIPRFAGAVRSFRPELIHTHMPVLKYVLPALALARRRPIVHTLHNVAEHEAARPDRAIQQIAFRTCVVPVAIGNAVANSIRRVYHLSPRRTIPNGIPVADYAPPPGAREEIRTSLGIPPEAPAFVAVGRLMQQKNHAHMIDAMASGRVREVGAHLLLAGDGALRGELELQARALHVDDCVHFLGKRDDVPAVLAAADVFVLSSLWEGHPLSVMEAMASGKPVVATAVGCVPEIVCDEAGLLVPPGDVAALETAMLALACDMPLARAKGAAARRAASERFDASSMARAYERLYGELA